MKRQIVVITGLSLICSSVIAEPIFMSVDNSQPLTTDNTANSSLSYGLSDEEITKRIKQGRADTIPMSALRRWQKNRKKNQHNQVWQGNSTVNSQQNRTPVMNEKYNTMNMYNEHYTNGINPAINNNLPMGNTPYQYPYPNYTPPTENQNVTQPPLVTESFNQPNQLNNNQTLTENPPFTYVTKVNTGQAETNKDTQNTSSQQANLSEKNDTIEKVAESEIEKELSQELPPVNENTQSTQKEPTNNQQVVTQKQKSEKMSEEVIKDETSQEK